MRLVGTTIAIVWAFIFSGALGLILFPKLVGLIPRPVLETVRIFLVIFLLASLLYAIAWLFLKGVRFLRAK